MGKQRTRYVCQACGATSPRWAGKCESCGEWNTLAEELIAAENRGRGAHHAAPVTVLPITQVEAERDHRFMTGIRELDRVLGGGIVPGSVTLLGGDPGIGKSTLMMQVCAVQGERPVLYVSGEESLRQIRLRAERLRVVSDRFHVLAETNLDVVLSGIESLNPMIVVIDSIQTMYRPELESAPGTISQVRESTALLLRYAKKSNVPVFLIGHVTKDGVIAGPRVLEHMVDTVLQFEGDHHHAYRIVRGMKNRFGSTNEIGIFEMQEGGLREVENPSEVFLSGRSRDASGACVCASLEGTRAVLVEVQALVTPSNFGIPQRSVTGLDGKRLSMLLAVLEKRCGLRTGQYDVFANVAGGLRIDEPAVDLAVATAVVSSARDVSIDPFTVVVGEIGLGGEVRSVSNPDKRVIEAEKLGFKTMILPKGNIRKSHHGAMRLVSVETVSDALNTLAH